MADRSRRRLCVGFVPVLGMALHNWVFGHVFVLFSSKRHNRRGGANAAVRLCDGDGRIAASSISPARMSGMAPAMGALARRTVGVLLMIPLNAAASSC